MGKLGPHDEVLSVPGYLYSRLKAVKEQFPLKFYVIGS